MKYNYFEFFSPGPAISRSLSLLLCILGQQNIVLLRGSIIKLPTFWNTLCADDALKYSLHGQLTRLGFSCTEIHLHINSTGL